MRFCLSALVFGALFSTSGLRAGGHDEGRAKGEEGRSVQTEKGGPERGLVACTIYAYDNNGAEATCGTEKTDKGCFAHDGINCFWQAAFKTCVNRWKLVAESKYERQKTRACVQAEQVKLDPVAVEPSAGTCLKEDHCTRVDYKRYGHAHPEYQSVPFIVLRDLLERYPKTLTEINIDYGGCSTFENLRKSGNQVRDAISKTVARLGVKNVKAKITGNVLPSYFHPEDLDYTPVYESRTGISFEVNGEGRVSFRHVYPSCRDFNGCESRQANQKVRCRPPGDATVHILVCEFQKSTRDWAWVDKGTVKDE